MEQKEELEDDSEPIAKNMPTAQQCCGIAGDVVISKHNR
jgi:hypothetical protein